VIEKRNKKRKEGAISASDAPKGQKPSAQGIALGFYVGVGIFAL
jgi:hypothetical protein